MDRTGIARLLLVVPLLAAGLALGAPRGADAAFACTTAIIGGTIKESVVVPAGRICSLGGVTVRGGVTVEAGANFHAFDGTEIRGPVTATAPTGFRLESVAVRGGVTVAGGTGLPGLTVNFSEVRGNLVVTGNTTRTSFSILLETNTVRGSIVLRDNTALNGGTILVQANAIEVDLDCSGNTPAPVGAGNTVEGEATGQCAGLVAP